ncbi:hypothetical protein N8I77_000888 [Diaporthe amygdali]|uniref:Integral membrane protein n=1 Tax=Phomopsis amygdali TaxID=1214568 RepID=A0AAD9W7K6_PHOAM|nr:hypothetical protein N8I77_000888 [Diaporthe amygdali]
MRFKARRDPDGQDENPYFDPRVTHPSSGLVPSRSAPQSHHQPQAQPQSQHAAASGTEPSTPARERPPPLTRPPASSSRGGQLGRQQSSIGLRRLRAPSLPTGTAPVATDWQQPNREPPAGDGQNDDTQGTGGRRRSSSDPQRPTWLTDPSHNGQGQSAVRHLPSVPELSESGPSAGRASRKGSMLFRPWKHNQQQKAQPQSAQDAEYDTRIVDLLDVLDPEVSTLTSITNVQNSLFIPSLGRWVNRRPTYDVSDMRAPAAGKSREEVAEQQRPPSHAEEQRPGSVRAYSISSNLDNDHYAVLPHGESLEGWSQEEVEMLNDHVRHMLHSRRSKFKRSLKGFGRYVSRPLGFFVTLYATLITLFGLAWVLFLIGWISIGSKQSYLINIIDYTLVALFAIMGDGLAPFRAVDTYHMAYIAHYHRLSLKLRQKLLLPKLRDPNDLPTDPVIPDVEAAAAHNNLADVAPGNDFAVLSPKQQETLVHHQTKYAKSHTFYKPHETETHFAFPLNLMITITTLLDVHSCLQISLGACTYGIRPENRPFALTTVILCCSITVNATAGLLIWIGDRQTRKKDVIERMTRQEMTEEAMHEVQKKKKKEMEAARSSSEEKVNGDGGWRESLSLPRLSLDKFGNAHKKGESSAALEKKDQSPQEAEGGFNTHT